MRQKVIAGNWKMYKDLAETRELLGALVARTAEIPEGVTAVVCPPFTSLSVAAEMVRGSRIRLGAQNMSEHDEGAFTGEISWKMLKSAGCDFVILGHSERRQYYGETDESVNRKAKKALRAALQPILCVGETLKERESGVTDAIVGGQVRGVLEGLTAEEMNRLIIAYEPVWAIGTGRTATPAQAEAVHAMIRGIVRNLYGDAVSQSLVIQYGGSVKPDNSAELLSQNDIDGALVGGACLKADSFYQIIRSAK